VALVTERVGGATRADGAYSIFVIYESTGANVVDHLRVENTCSEPVHVRVTGPAGETLYEDWFGGGAAKNPANPGTATDVAPPAPNLSWRRATKQTTWGIGFSYPAYPPEGTP
jgi:hypothetical protein